MKKEMTEQEAYLNWLPYVLRQSIANRRCVTR